jgi:hypothetical protein
MHAMKYLSESNMGCMHARYFASLPIGHLSLPVSAKGRVLVQLEFESQPISCFRAIFPRFLAARVLDVSGGKAFFELLHQKNLNVAFDLLH